MEKTLLVMGGDKRMEYCADELRDGFLVHTYGFSDSGPIWELGQSDILVLPYFSLAGHYLNTPLLSQKIPAVSALDMLKYGGTVFGGGLTPEFLSYCCERGACVHDFFDDEDLTLKNAELTAEGALGIIIQNTESALCEMKILITGFGRVGKACAELMSKTGSEIYVYARSETARDEAESLGFHAMPFSDPEPLKDADVIINTVPKTVISETELLEVKKDAFILDLASSPYGVDFDAAKRLNIRAQTAPGLPGKTAPKTAGKLIAQSIRKLAKGGGEGG